MNFFHRTQSAKVNEFSRMQSDGLVSLEEIVSNLSDPENSVKSSTRTLKIAFKMDELEPYFDTII